MPVAGQGCSLTESVASKCILFSLVCRSVRFWLIFFTYLVILQVTQFCINYFSFSLFLVTLLSPNCCMNNIFYSLSPVYYCRSIIGKG